MRYSAKRRSDIVRKAVAMTSMGASLNQVSRKLGVPYHTLRRWLKEEGLTPAENTAQPLGPVEADEEEDLSSVNRDELLRQFWRIYRQAQAAIEQAMEYAPEDPRILKDLIQALDLIHKRLVEIYDEFPRNTSEEEARIRELQERREKLLRLYNQVGN